MRYTLNMHELKQIKTTTLGYLFKLSAFLNKYGYLSNMGKTLDKKFILKYLSIRSVNTYKDLLLDLKKVNILKLDNENNIYINPRYIRHDRFDNNKKCLNLFETDPIKNINKYCVYRFLNKEQEVLYVGRTINLKKRISVHLKSGHLPKSCYDNLDVIQYIVFDTFLDMCLYEIYYINLYDCIYNKKDKDCENHTTVIFKDRQWINMI